MNLNQNNLKTFSVIVIGGGHAGIEASLISAKLGHKVALITLDKNKIGAMNCNPSIGGSAKGVVVREIDALGGEMGKAADATALQFKLLNTSGGPAIQVLRVQSDKIAYSRYMQKVVSEQVNLTLIEGAVNNLLVEKKKIMGVRLKNNETILAPIVILTTGTYLQPVTYRGQETKIEGPEGEKKVVNNLTQQLKELGFRIKRFLTGTCPRILTNTIDFSNLKVEPGTNLPLRFSVHSNLANLLPFSQQLPCYLLHTNEKTHQIVRDNLHLSSLAYQKDTGPAPLYCPGIEGKVTRFPDEKRHQIFLEPESRELDTTYIQGLSTSLPVEIQAQILKTLPGLENVQVKKWGYDIAYDLVDSTQLKTSLESELVAGLFTAGQINGTTGYEEAAAQGLMAGINASRKLKKQKPLVLKRSEAYIGVLIDDLVNSEEGINDPYRLFPSRAEYRLSLRNDNAHTRLWPIARNLGLLSQSQWELFQARKEFRNNIVCKLKELTFLVDEKFSQNFPQLDISKWKRVKIIRGYDLLKDSKVISLSHFTSWVPEISQLSWEEKREVEIDAKYEGYIQIDSKRIEQTTSEEYDKKSIPENIDYSQINNLAKEARTKLTKIRPISLGQAKQIAGVDPSDIQALGDYLTKNFREKNNFSQNSRQRK